MKNFVVFLLVFAFFGFSLFSQEYRIAGRVTNEEGIPIAYANVFLLDSTYTTLIKGASANDKGFFSIANIAKGSYYIKASYIENESEPEILELAKDVDEFLIVLKENQELEEVVVVSQQPRFEQKVDRLVFSIANTSLADADIWEVLKRTPSVVIIQNEITVKGSKNVGVMINDRLVNLPQQDIINLLSGTSASNVESIEVITNPPARYSAEGGLLINIKMNKNLVSGYNGAIFNRYTQGVFPKHTLGTDHYFKGKKTDFSVNYSFSDTKNLTRYTDIASFLEGDQIATVWTAEQEQFRRQNRHNLSVFFDVQINDNNRIGLSSINSYLPKVNRFYDSETLIDDPEGNLLSSFVTLNDSDEDRLNSSVYFDWVHQMKKEGAELSVNAHYTYYDSNRDQALETDFQDLGGNLTGENDFTTESEQRIDLFSFQIDYESPLGESSQFETGLRYAGIDSRSTISQEGFDRNQPGINPTEAGRFDYDEAIYAGYLSLNGKWQNWRLKTGLRAEYTETLGDLDTDPEKTENDYLELFPSVSLNYAPSKKHAYTLYYYRRINRPRYNSINPFQYFQSNNSVIEGNPNLLPATRNYVAMGYTFDRNYSFEVFYKNQKNQYRSQVFQDNEANLLRFISANIVRDISYGADVSINKDITNRWNCYFLLSGYYLENQFRDLDTGQVLDNGLWTMFLRTSQGFLLLPDRSLTADVDFVYYAPLVVGNSRQDSYNELSISFRKTLWNKRASISMGVADIFNQGNLFNTRVFLNQNNTSSFRPENRLFTFGFRYRFGNVGIRDNKKSKRVDERNRI